MRRQFFLLMLILMALTAAPVSAQGLLPLPRANNPPLVINASANNDFDDAWVFYPNIAITVQNVENANIEIGEVVHNCTGSTGTNSVWFVTYLTAGKLSLDTAGSAFVTENAPTDDTVMSLYRLTGDQTTVDFSTLAPVACSTNGTGAAQIVKQTIDTGIYLVQISLQADVGIVAGSSISLTATYVPTQKASMDEPNKAKAVTFPQIYGIGTFISATVALDEPVDPLLPPVQLARSVWFKFTLKASARVLILGQVAYYVPLVSVFQKTGGTLTPVASGGSDEGLATYVLAKGTYLIRLAHSTAQEPAGDLDDSQMPFGLAALFVSLQLTPQNSGFGVSENTVNASGSLDGWTLTNATLAPDPAPDALVCGFVAQHCGFQMTSTGAGEATTLTGTLKLGSVKLSKGDMIRVTAFGSHTGSGHVLMTLELTDANGKKLKFSSEAYPSADGATSLLVVPKNFTPVKAKVSIRNLTTVIGDEVIIDAIGVYPVRVGTSVGRN